MRILDEPVPIGRIFLDLTNPRHVPFTTEDEAIKYLCDNEDIWPLARDITSIGTNPLERVALLQGYMHLTEQASRIKLAERDRPAITPAMIEAGVERLGDLLEAETGSAYVVEEVFLAMDRLAHSQPVPRHPITG